MSGPYIDYLHKNAKCSSIPLAPSPSESGQRTEMREDLGVGIVSKELTAATDCAVNQSHDKSAESNYFNLLERRLEKLDVSLVKQLRQNATPAMVERLVALEKSGNDLILGLEEIKESKKEARRQLNFKNVDADTSKDVGKKTAADVKLEKRLSRLQESEARMRRSLSMNRKTCADLLSWLTGRRLNPDILC